MIPQHFVTAVDAQGRTYVESPVFPDDSPLKRAHADDRGQRCVECGAVIRHAWDRYYQRNDPTDGQDTHPLVALLEALTYDAVCGPCGDRAIRSSAT